MCMQEAQQHLQICLDELSIKAYPRERHDFGFSTTQMHEILECPSQERDGNTRSLAP